MQACQLVIEDLPVELSRLTCVYGTHMVGIGKKLQLKM